jgi:hypothetical protein
LSRKPRYPAREGEEKQAVAFLKKSSAKNFCFKSYRVNVSPHRTGWNSRRQRISPGHDQTA